MKFLNKNVFIKLNSIIHQTHLIRNFSKCGESTPIFCQNEVKRFIMDCLKCVGAPDDHAEQMSDLLIEADLRGFSSHGINRLPRYILDVQLGVCDPKAKPKILKQDQNTAWVDGQNAFGVVVSNFANCLVIEKAKSKGIAIVVCNNSNHYGICSFYSMQAIKEGLISFTCTNTSPLSSPPGSNQAFLGTNPFCFGAPISDDDYFMLDMATTTVSVGKIEIKKKKKEKIPKGWALNEKGDDETDPTKAKLLLPLGGSLLTSGYKGQGLQMMVEILCGILANANYADKIRSWKDNKSKNPTNLGHCFIAINPKNFAPNFQERLADLVKRLRGVKSKNACQPIMAAGDKERNHIKMINEVGGFKYLQRHLDICKSLADQLKVKPLTPANN